MGLDFGEVQREIQIHFGILIICATMFTVGVALFIYEFIKYGLPNDEALEQTNNF
jgi:nitric oxide reductase subunit B